MAESFASALRLAHSLRSAPEKRRGDRGGEPQLCFSNIVCLRRVRSRESRRKRFPPLKHVIFAFFRDKSLTLSLLERFPTHVQILPWRRTRRRRKERRRRQFERLFDFVGRSVGPRCKFVLSLSPSYKNAAAATASDTEKERNFEMCRRRRRSCHSFPFFLLFAAAAVTT